jgi:uncharacterized membrane protein
MESRLSSAAAMRRPACERDARDGRRHDGKRRARLTVARASGERIRGAQFMPPRISMNQLVVIAFDHFDDARDALRKLRELEREGRVHFEDTALVERDPDGTAHVKNEVSGTTERATVIGAMVGGIVAFLFPLAGMAIGAAAGAAIGAALDTGVSAGFVDEEKETLRPGRSALFLVVKEADADAVMAALRSYRGDVIQTTLSTEVEEALRDSLSRARARVG